MCKANDRYWEREAGKEVICKCGKTHHKERRAKPKTCKQCLAEDNLKQLLIDADKTKRNIFRLIGVWQCTSCEIIKPESKFHADKNYGARGMCKDCFNRSRRDKWVNNEEWRESKKERSNVFYNDNRELLLSKKKEYNKANYVYQPHKYENGDSSLLSVINCPDCGEYEVKKQAKHVRCLCGSCYKKREARNRHYLFALQNNGINNTIDYECRGKCGTVIPAAYGIKAAWCVPCKERSEQKQKRMSHASKRRRRRGGRVHGVTYDPYAVFKRDKWRCYICNTKTQKKDIYSDNAAEIDHVIPLSKGGKDIPSNVKCCCRSCNRDKSDKIIPVVGNLFCQV